MFILVVGSPETGFAVVGPYASEEAAGDAGEWARNEYGDGSGNDWWVFKLNAGIETTLDEMDPAGAVVVFGGSIIDGWLFYGPFKDAETAYGGWPCNDGLGADCVIELQPVQELETT
jgi:hypothetical protein